MLINIVIGIAFFIGVITIILYLIWTPLFVIGPLIVRLHPFRFRAIRLANLSSIQFHYHGAVGFSCVWEFTPISGSKMLAEANGIDEWMLSRLERRLPGFSKNAFDREYGEGDVEGSIDVWHTPRNKIDV